MSNEIDIDPYLVEQLVRGDLVPVIGDELNAAGSSARHLPDPHQLAKLLFARLDSSIDLSGHSGFLLPHAAEYYEAERGRHALTDFLKSHLGARDVVLSEAQRLAAMLPGPTLLTTSFSHTAVEAVRANAHRACSVVVDESDTYYARADQKLILKLFGCIDRADSLIITERDYSKFSRRLEHFCNVVQSYLGTKALLFLGSDVDAFWMGELDRRRPQNLHTPFSYIVGTSLSPAAQTIWRSRNYKIIELEPATFLRKLLSLIRSRPTVRRGSAHVGSLPLRPYKLLDWFEGADVEIFFGRETDADRLVYQVETQPLTILVGASGVGKTSLLKAGLIPRFIQAGHRVYYIRALTHPTEAIKEAIITSERRGTLDSGASLVRLIEEALPNDSMHIFVVDQFEEFFLRFGEESRRAFASTLRECLRIISRDIHFIFALREDHLHHLLEMEPPITGVFEHRFWLRNFDESSAREAIRNPAILFSLEIEDVLVERLLIDLRQTQSDGIEPAQLQLVCSTLDNERGESNKLSLVLYEQLGCTSNILANYLERVLNELSPDAQTNAKAILKCLVTTEQTKATMTAREIRRDAIVRQLGTNEETVRETIRRLQNLRLVRRVQGDEDVYELAHETLVRTIWRWIDDSELDSKYARQVLQQALMDWRHTKTLPDDNRWHVISSKGGPALLGTEEGMLVMRAALQRNDEVNRWITQAFASGVSVWDELKIIVESAHPDMRHNALRWVMQSPSTSNAIPILSIALSSEYAALRRQARRAIRRASNIDVEDVVPEDREPSPFVHIESGWFEMGTGDTRFQKSGPRHSVFLDAYDIQRFPVTNIEYQEFILATNRPPPSDAWIEGRPPLGLEDCPVVQVTWYDAEAYCKWYSEKITKLYRLPTEAEWEKAAAWDPINRRQNLWAWGNEFDSSKANTRGSGPGRITPIGQYSPVGDSAYGVSDMCGNTFDWVWDWWSPDYYADSPSRNPTGPATGSMKSARGGSWAGSPKGAAAVSHYYTVAPGIKNEYIGFRLVCVSSP